jgi:hypothetical protein
MCTPAHGWGKEEEEELMIIRVDLTV